MESEQFASLGDRITFEVFDKDQKNLQKEERSEVELTRRHSFILFDEIIESSPTQSRTVVFDPENIEKDKVLLESIQSNGIITPIIVRELEQDGQINDPFLQKKSGREDLCPGRWPQTGSSRHSSWFTRCARYDHQAF